jgi:hypothetical protein
MLKMILRLSFNPILPLKRFVVSASFTKVPISFVSIKCALRLRLNKAMLKAFYGWHMRIMSRLAPMVASVGSQLTARLTILAILSMARITIGPGTTFMSVMKWRVRLAGFVVL